MDRSVLKNITFAVIVVIVGVVLRSIDTLSQTRLWRWSLGDFVAWASFTAAAAIAAHMAGEIGSRTARPVLGSAALSRILGVVALGISLWLLHTAVRPVTTSDWVPIIQKVFAFSIVALAGYALWLAHQGFDEIARALAPVRPAGARPSAAGAAAPAAPAAPAGPGVAGPAPGGLPAAFCAVCGGRIPEGQRFCGSCGRERQPVQGD